MSDKVAAECLGVDVKQIRLWLESGALVGSQPTGSNWKDATRGDQFVCKETQVWELDFPLADSQDTQQMMDIPQQAAVRLV